MKAFEELEQGVHAALETYSNVHRGSGHNSMVTTHLYEQARGIVLEYLGLNKNKYRVVFCTPRYAAILAKQLSPENYQMVSNNDVELPLGVRALAVKRNALPKGAPFHTGGGTAKLISREWIIWADGSEKFEAGTPAIVNIIAFAIALRLIEKSGKEIFMQEANKMTAEEIIYHDELEKFQGFELLSQLRKTLIGCGLCVPTAEGSIPFINLDNSASTPTFEPVWKAFVQTLRQPKEVKQEIIRGVKSICAKTLGAPEESFDVIFTSNTTEAINIAAESLGRESDINSETVILNTLLEHSSNDLPWRMVPHSSLIRLSADTEGFIDLKELENILSAYNEKELHGKKRIKMVAVSGASNVLGVCNDIAEIGRIVHRYGARLLVDAAQLVAHRSVDMEKCGIDYLAFSAHKIYAPFGSGALVVKKDLLKFSAAEMDEIRSSGEENAGGIASLGKAFVLLQRIGMDLIEEEERVLTAYTLKSLSKIKGLKIFGIQDPVSTAFKQKTGVILVNLESMMANKVAKELAVRSGIGVRFGCHCAHIMVKRVLNVSPGLEKFQRVIQTLFPKLRLPGLTRISLGIQNSKEEIDHLVQALSILAGPASTAGNGKSQLPHSEVKKQMNEFIKASALKVYSIQ